MNGRLALYRDQYGIVPVVMSLAAILWTTMVLTAVQSNLMADTPGGLALAYLLPTIFIAVFLAVVSGLQLHSQAGLPLLILSTRRSSAFSLPILGTSRN